MPPKEGFPEMFEISDETFVLVSRSRKLVTEGCFRRISAPAKNSAGATSEFHENIEKALNEAKIAGIKNPIVVGAIPFDCSQPSALYIPRAWRSLTSVEVQEYAKSAENIELKASTPRSIPEYSEFTKIVGKAICSIRNKSLKKVVLSRLLEIQLSSSVESKALLARLLAQNQDAYNFHVPLPDGGCLIGSSPELLARKEGSCFESMPLAGSAKRNVQDPINDEMVAQSLLASEKDRHEHQLVIDSLRDTLSQSKRFTQLNIPERPSCISTSKLWHLATHVKGTVADSSESAISLACLLHPTPALNGFPHDVGRRMISELEPFDREYFGGIVGFCDSNGDGEWVVAIRCGKVTEEKVSLFAGAGIVADSVPDLEWQETGAKLSTMLRAFGLTS